MKRTHNHNSIPEFLPHERSPTFATLVFLELLVPAKSDGTVVDAATAAESLLSCHSTDFACSDGLGKDLQFYLFLTVSAATGLLYPILRLERYSTFSPSVRLLDSESERGMTCCP